MFVLARMTDTVRIDPELFSEDFQDSLRNILNQKFANKVVLNLGLCMCLFDFEKIEDSCILPGDGASHTKVHFRYVVFRPFVDEVLTGSIMQCSREGIKLTMGFFDDIFVPSARLPENSSLTDIHCVLVASVGYTNYSFPFMLAPAFSNDNEQTWIWNYTDDGGNVAEMFMEPGSEVRFRVVAESFRDNMPNSSDKAEEVRTSSAEATPSYLVTGSMSESGLGCLAWWRN